ncbi:uncharacterized protein [Palaemon carinicauda]|uniref:uncharacterized protein isoform X2 n=1 Tax=Palaemon carinicauda TaxID=392227 RepID=UPI0035B5E8B4
MVGVPGGASGGGVGVGVGVGVAGDVIGGGEGEDLRRAAAQGDTSKVLALLEEGADVNLTDEVGYTALQRAACEGHVDIVRQLIKNSANVDHQDDQHGNTALHEAAWKGYSQTAEALVRAKANVYIKNKGGFAPLHLACQNGHNQTCRVLLLAGCRPDIKNNYGDTPLHTAARYGHAGVTRILLSARINVGEMNKNGDTALHIAAAMGRRKLTRILLESAADQTVKNKQNETPGDIAKRKEFDQILEILKNPPPIVTVEERLRMEQEQKKREAREAKAKGLKGAKGGGGKGDKKREKTNDSGTSSKDSSTRAKEKKKHKSEHKEKRRVKHVEWSPYGCQFYPPVTAQELAAPKLDSLPKDPLSAGEQYFIDLAGNIKKGPVGIGYTCYCAPFFKNVENKLEKDKIALMDHIDAANDKLDAKITNLEHRTRSHIQHLSDNVRQKLAAEKEECRQRAERTRTAKEAESEARVAQLQQWVERRLASSQNNVGSNTQFPRTYAFRGSVRRNRDPVTGLFPLTRSRSEEAISEYREEGESDKESVYKGLRVLDHPTSMYNIPQTLQDEADAVIYDSPKPVVSVVPGILCNPSLDHRQSRSTSADRQTVALGTRAREVRSQSVDARHILNEDSNKGTEKITANKFRGNNTAWIPTNRDLLNESTSSDASAGRRGSRGSHGMSAPSTQGSPMVGRINPYSPAQPSPLLKRPELEKQQENVMGSKQSPVQQAELNKAVDNLRVSQSSAEHGAIPKTNGRTEEFNNGDHNVSNQAPRSEWSGYSRYDYRNTNPYMYGDLRGQNPLARPQPIVSVPPETESKPGYEAYPKYPTTIDEAQVSETFHGHPTQLQEDYEGSNYLDMDRYRIQQAVRRLYDGYLAEGRLEGMRTGGRPHLESSMEHDSHNDSGYSTRMCTGSQGPSPALSGGHELAGDSEAKNSGGTHVADAARGPVESTKSLPHYPERTGSFPPVPPSRYSNGLPPPVVSHSAIGRFSAPHIPGDTVFIGESSLV